MIIVDYKIGDLSRSVLLSDRGTPVVTWNDISACEDAVKRHEKTSKAIFAGRDYGDDRGFVAELIMLDGNDRVTIAAKGPMRNCSYKVPKQIRFYMEE